MGAQNILYIINRHLLRLFRARRNSAQQISHTCCPIRCALVRVPARYRTCDESVEGSMVGVNCVRVMIAPWPGRMDLNGVLSITASALLHPAGHAVGETANLLFIQHIHRATVKTVPRAALG